MAAAYLDLGDVEMAESLRDQYVAQGGTEFGIAVLDSLLSLYRGDDVLAAEHAEVAVRQVPREWREMRVLRDRAIMDGKADTAFQWYQDGFPELFDQEHLEITRRNLDPAIDLAFLYTRAGQPEKAERLLTECESFIRKLTRLGTVGYRVADVQIAMIRGGPRERALQLLRQAVDAGWREDWWFSLQHDLALEPLKEEAGFHVLLAEIRADMAEQLARLRERQITSEQNSN